MDPLWKTTGTSLGILYLNYICYVPHLCIYQYNFTIIFIIRAFIFELFCKNRRFLFFHAIPAVFFEWYYFLICKVNYLHCVLTQRFTKPFQSSPLYTSRLFSIPSNTHIVDTKCQQGICSPSLVVDDFSGLFLHPSTVLIKDSRSA